MDIAKKISGGVTAPNGFYAGTTYVGIKSHKKYKPDVAVLYSERPFACAACFTKNKFCAAPVVLGREVLKKGSARAFVINSGNANAGTGTHGIEDARTVERTAEKLLGLGEGEVIVSSTGVIAKCYPLGKCLTRLRRLSRQSLRATTEAMRRMPSWQQIKCARSTEIITPDLSIHFSVPFTAKFFCAIERNTPEKSDIPPRNRQLSRRIKEWLPRAFRSWQPKFIAAQNRDGRKHPKHPLWHHETVLCPSRNRCHRSYQLYRHILPPNGEARS